MDYWNKEPSTALYIADSTSKHTLVKTTCLALALLVVFIGFGCRSAPMYEVESYQALQAEFADYPDIFFVDIFDYDNAPDMMYWVDFSGGYGCSERVLVGYTVGGGRPVFKDGVEFTYFSFGCYNKTYNVAVDEYEPNKVYRGIPMQDISKDWSEDYNDPNRPTAYPQGTYVYRVDYQFDLRGYRYSMGGSFIITPDELPRHDKEQARQVVETRILTLTDSILDQGGIPR